MLKLRSLIFEMNWFFIQLVIKTPWNGQVNSSLLPPGEYKYQN